MEQAKEKNKEIWDEMPLCDLEKKYHTEEDRKWLLDTIVNSRAEKRPRGHVFAKKRSEQRRGKSPRTFFVQSQIMVIC